MKTVAVLTWLLLISVAHGDEPGWSWKTGGERWQWTVTERPRVQPVVQPQPVYWTHPAQARPLSPVPMRWSGFRAGNC